MIHITLYDHKRRRTAVQAILEDGRWRILEPGPRLGPGWPEVAPGGAGLEEYLEILAQEADAGPEWPDPELRIAEYITDQLGGRILDHQPDLGRDFIQRGQARLPIIY